MPNAQKTMTKDGKKLRTQKNKERRAEKRQEREYDQNVKMRAKRAERADRKAEITKQITQGTYKPKTKRNGVGNILITRKVKDPDNPKSTIDEIVAILPCCEAKSFTKCHHSPLTGKFFLPRNAKNLPAVLC